MKHLQFSHSIRSDLKYLVLLMIISIPLILPFVHKGYFPTHDGEWAIVRLADMYRTVVQDMQIPARYSGYLNAGYGYPLFNFAYPGPYYLGLLPLILNLGYVGSIKFLFAVSIPLSAIGMFYLSKRLWKSSLAGLASSIIYLYVPYRMVDLFIRGSIGESLSFAIFPFLFLLAIQIVESKKPALPAVAFSILLALLIGTHNIMTVLFVPILVLFSAVLVWLKNKNAWKSFILSFALGVGLASFFWLPAIVEKQYIWLSKIPIADRSLYFVSFTDLIIPKWGYAPPTDPDGFSYQIGIAQIIILILSIALSGWLFVKRRKTLSVINKIGIFLTAACVLAIVMMMRQTGLLWNIVPLLSEINYPWTLLSQIVFLIALLSGYVLIQTNLLKTLIILLSVIAIVLTIQYAKPKEYVDRGDGFYVTNSATTTSSDEYLSLSTQQKPLKRADNKIEFVSGSGEISDLIVKSNRISFTADLAEGGYIDINTIFYPGWKAKVNNKNVQISTRLEDKYDVMGLSLDSGISYVELTFTETPLRLASDIVSLVSIIGAFIILFIKPVRNRVNSLLVT